jgi:hypothetical protein
MRIWPPCVIGVITPRNQFFCKLLYAVWWVLERGEEEVGMPGRTLIIIIAVVVVVILAIVLQQVL